MIVYDEIVTKFFHLPLAKQESALVSIVDDFYDYIANNEGVNGGNVSAQAKMMDILRDLGRK